jgi:hypothetical protein
MALSEFVFNKASKRILRRNPYMGKNRNLLPCEPTVEELRINGLKVPEGYIGPKTSQTLPTAPTAPTRGVARAKKPVTDPSVAPDRKLSPDPIPTAPTIEVEDYEPGKKTALNPDASPAPQPLHWTQVRKKVIDAGGQYFNRADGESFLREKGIL